MPRSAVPEQLPLRDPARLGILIQHPGCHLHHGQVVEQSAGLAGAWTQAEVRSCSGALRCRRDQRTRTPPDVDRLQVAQLEEDCYAVCSLSEDSRRTIVRSDAS